MKATIKILIPAIFGFLIACGSADQQEKEQRSEEPFTESPVSEQAPAEAPAAALGRSPEQARQPVQRQEKQNLPSSSTGTSSPKSEPGGVQAVIHPLAAVERSQEPEPPQESEPQPVYVVVPEGTTLEVRLEEKISSEENQTGDSFTATLEEEYVANGEVVIPRGSLVTGRLLEVRESGKVKGRARVQLGLESITVGDAVYPVESSRITLEAEGSKGKDAKIIGGGAGIGAVVGAIAGGKKGAAVGGIIGASAGTAGVLLTKGEKVELPVEQLLNFQLNRPVEIRVR